MDADSLAVLSLIISIVALVTSILAVRYLRRQAAAAEAQVGPLRRQATAAEEHVEILREQLKGSGDRATPLRRLYTTNLGGGTTEYQFSDGKLVAAHRTMGGGVTYVADGDVVRADDPVYAHHIAIIENRAG